MPMKSLLTARFETSHLEDFQNEGEAGELSLCALCCPFLFVLLSYTKMSASAMMRSITEERANEYQMHQRSPLLGSRSPIAARTIGSPRLPTVRTRQRTHSAPPPYSPRCPSAKWPLFLAAGAACLVYGLSLLVQRHRPSIGNSSDAVKL